MNPQTPTQNLQNVPFFAALSAADQVTFLSNQSALLGLQAAQQTLQAKGNAQVVASQQAAIQAQMNSLAGSPQSPATPSSAS